MLGCVPRVGGTVWLCAVVVYGSPLSMRDPEACRREEKSLCYVCRRCQQACADRPAVCQRIICGRQVRGPGLCGPTADCEGPR